MKTPTEDKFDRIIKKGFHEILRPIGFRKRGNNFYLQKAELGQIINIQKSIWYSKSHIHFTINVGVFLPEHWLGLYYNQGKDLPNFPPEVECLIKRRIGRLRNQNDTWYDVDIETDESSLVNEMNININKYILPFFEQLSSRENLVNAIQSDKLLVEPLNRLIVFGELKMNNNARVEYDYLLSNSSNIHFLETVKRYGQKYGLI
ncbi:DUF4304 domain-containing protein [Flavihumibacter sediminis]|nr:DUF4304 domain-containing protein [Flavihumibacter sediminis]